MTEQTDTLTADEIAALPGMVAGATPGPWDCHYGRDDCACDCKAVLGEHGGMGAICVIEVDNGLLISDGGNDAPDKIQAKANARLIALTPRLAATVTAQQREIERLQTVVDNMHSVIREHHATIRKLMDAPQEKPHA